MLPGLVMDGPAGKRRGHAFLVPPVSAFTRSPPVALLHAMMLRPHSDKKAGQAKKMA
jgi:hypothetical protein